MTEVIAEAGVAHNGKLDLAKRLALAAKTMGADAVKFQTFIPEKILRRNDPDFSLVESLALSQTDFKALALYCRDLDIEFFTTPGERDSLKFAVEELGVKRIKIGSDDMTNYPLLFAARETTLPIIMSTGMASLSEIWDALCATSKYDVTLLHCVSLYPCPTNKANIGAIPAMKRWLEENQAIGVKVGYSDHTADPYTIAAAVAAGASMIEAHIKLTDAVPLADVEVSFFPGDFFEMLTMVRNTEAIMGTGIKAPCKEELQIVDKLRKGADGLRGVADASDGSYSREKWEQKAARQEFEGFGGETPHFMDLRNS